MLPVLGATGPQGELGGRVATGEVLGLLPGSGGPHAFALLPPLPLFVEGEIALGGADLLLLFAMIGLSLRSAINPPSHFLQTQRAKEKKLTSQRRWSLLTCIPIRLLPRPCTRKRLGHINRRPILCVDPRRRPDDGSRCFRWGRFDFDRERPTERSVGYVFGWDGAPMCGWVGFVDYTGVC